MQVTSNGRVRCSEAEWREIITRYEASGLGTREFCRREPLHLTSFLRWQRKLATGGGDFIPVTSASAAPTAWRLEITLPNGCQLRFLG